MNDDFLYTYLRRLINFNHINDLMFFLSKSKNPKTVDLIRLLYRNKEIPQEIADFLKLQEL